MNLIVRTIMPLVDDPGTHQQGFGDITQSFFFSPPSHNGLTWALGPYYPTGADGLSAAKWGVGPTALVVKQQGGLTYFLLANQIWSVAGASNHDDISALFLQPFFNYTFPNTTGVSVNLESTYDWEHEK